MKGLECLAEIAKARPFPGLDVPLGHLEWLPPTSLRSARLVGLLVSEWESFEGPFGALAMVSYLMFVDAHGGNFE